MQLSSIAIMEAATISVLTELISPILESSAHSADHFASPVLPPPRLVLPALTPTSTIIPV